MSEQPKTTKQDTSAFTVPFDVIELPSKGLLYPSSDGNLKVEYMTAEDENILTSPNLVQSGKVLDVLIERKIKDDQLKAKDLLVGDRNAIMVFLRSTSYGEMYPVKLTDPETGEEFETEVDLSKLPVKSIGASPNEEGLFEFNLKRMKKDIKFRLLTSQDEENLIKAEEKRKKLLKTQVSKLLTNRLVTQIVEVDGNRDKSYIEQFVNYLPAGDSLDLRKYIDDIEPGIDLRADVESPSGAVFRSLVPITVQFFWPNVRL
tara:strand:+ start:57 stop:836 length:780 start_codon:yes stop_codon:yes gene_type:complete